MKAQRIWFAVFSVAVLLIAAAGLYLYFKPAPDALNKKAAFQLDAPTLLSAFEINETEARSSYLNQVIEVSGKVQASSLTANQLNLVLGSSESFYGINCSFTPGQESKLTKVRTGDHVTVKGLCKGYLDDVILTQCILIAHEK